MGKVIIKKLDCFGRHGVLKEENVLGQRFFVSCELETSFERASESDDIKQAVNYAQAAELITAFVRDNTFKLIETLADRLAFKLLTTFDINAAAVTVEKPSAPIGLPLETVGVTVEKKWERIYLSIGSNMGDKRANMDFAVERLSADEGIRLVRTSGYIETEPYGNENQDSFLNACIEANTLYSPHKLLEVINGIEAEAGRKRELRWGPRTLDIDIIFYGDRVIYDDKLIIPHIDMHNRAFVLEPLCAINPYAIDPLTGETAEKLLEKLKAGKQ